MRFNKDFQFSLRHHWIKAMFVAWCLLVCLAPSYGQETTQEETPQEQALALTAQAVEEFNEGQFKSALDLLNQSLKVNEPVYETHYWLGRVFATKAASSDSARQQAIAHFQRALELQPFGETGDLSRAWLSRFDGRPKWIIVSSVLHPLLKTYDSDSTEAVVRMVSATARTNGISTTSVTNSPIKLADWTNDSLAKLCQGDKGELKNGWFIGVAVERVEGSKSRAKIWIFDPLAKQLYKPTSVSTSLDWPKFELKNSNAPTTGDSTLDALSAKIWQRCRPIVGGDFNPKMLDEVVFPSAMSGVYSRSAAPYEEARQQPTLMLAPLKAVDEDDEDTAREVGINLQQAILEPKRFAVISPSGTHQVLRQIGVTFEAATTADWVRAGQEAKCRYVIVPTLTRFELKTQVVVFVTKVKAIVGLNITIIDCEAGKEVSSKLYEKSASSTKLGTNGLTELLKKRAEILNQAIQEAAVDVGKLNVSATP